MSKRARNAGLLLGILVVSLSLYSAAESGSGSLEAILLGVLVALMGLTVLNR